MYKYRAVPVCVLRLRMEVIRMAQSALNNIRWLAIPSTRHMANVTNLIISPSDLNALQIILHLW